MPEAILGAGDLLPQLFRAERRVQELAELTAAEDAAMAALIAAYNVPEPAQETHQRIAEQRQLALAAIVARIRAARHLASQVLP
jgi:hypothetical protein